MYIAILGRQPDISMAELESCFGASATKWFSQNAATVKVDELNIEQLGGTVKAGTVSAQISSGNWHKISKEIIAAYTDAWRDQDKKITLGISAYGFDVSARDVQKIGIVIKQQLKKSGVSVRLIPNAEPHLNTAASHHNKLGLSPNKVELLIVRGSSGKTIVAESTGAQNITALARRDQGRPKRDAFVGMLPPKLAMIMLNLAVPRADQNTATPLRLLDPFCGTGVILQEAALRGFTVYGTDLSDKMVNYSQQNLQWLLNEKRLSAQVTVHQGDAMDCEWEQPIDLVASETYLGQPFSAPPSPQKLEQVKVNVNHITTVFLRKIHDQLQDGTPLCLAVPAWRDADGRLTHLPLTRSFDDLGYKQVTFSNVEPHDLVYYREDQIVARQLLVLTKA